MKINLPTRRRYCDGVTRRDFLTVGGLTALGLTMGGLLEARAASAATTPAAESIILIWLGGGASQLDTFDPKPEAPPEIRGHFGTIPTKLPGIRFSDRMPKLAANTDKFTIVRSMTHPDRNHGSGDHLMLSGYLQSPATAYPAIGSVMGRVLGYKTALPPFVAVPNSSVNAGYLGSAWSAFRVSGDPNSPAFTVRDMQPPMEVNASRLERRGDLLKLVDEGVRAFEKADGPRSLTEFYRRANTIMTSSEAREAFDLRGESESLRAKYGRTTLGQSALLARRLVERGVRMVTVAQNNWDHHANIFSQLDEGMLSSVDQVVTALLTDLQDRGMLDKTIVMLTGEFGRTPSVNYAVGRDHWPDVFSVLVAGGGIRGGQIYGASDAKAAYPAENPVTPQDLLATFYQQLGIDTETELHTPDGRPIKVLDQGEVVKGLL